MAAVNKLLNFDYGFSCDLRTDQMSLLVVLTGLAAAALPAASAASSASCDDTLILSGPDSGILGSLSCLISSYEPPFNCKPAFSFCLRLKRGNTLGPV